MLRDGQFIKEELPRIGKFYIPQVREEDRTPEERFMQDLLLSYRQEQNSFLSKIFGFLLRM